MLRQGNNSPPELLLVIWGFLLNAAWEFLHSSLYVDHATGWAYVLWSRVHCTVGDVLILLVCFWLTALVMRSRHWFAKSNRLLPSALFVIFGLAYTMFSEWFNTTIRESWTYAASMPTVVGIGLSPILQWIVIPPIIVLILSKSKKPDRN